MGKKILVGPRIEEVAVTFYEKRFNNRHTGITLVTESFPEAYKMQLLAVLKTLTGPEQTQIRRAMKGMVLRSENYGNNLKGKVDDQLWEKLDAMTLLPECAWNYGVLRVFTNSITIYYTMKPLFLIIENLGVAMNIKSELIKLSAQMALCTNMPSTEYEDWDWPKGMPITSWHKVYTASSKANEQCRQMAIALRNIANLIEDDCRLLEELQQKTDNAQDE